MIVRLQKGGDTEPADFLPLRGYDPRTLASEIVDHRDEWNLSKFASPIGARPVLLLTADDGSETGSTLFQQVLKAAGNTHVEKIHTATDHSFSGRRVYLASTVLQWLSDNFH
jgi:hypothetical protein